MTLFTVTEESLRDEDNTAEAELIFKGSEEYTLGVELEFQLVDCKTLDLVSKADAILRDSAVKKRDRVVSEMWQSIIEVKTDICSSTHEVEKDLRNSVQIVEQAAQKQGCLLYSSGLHPFTLKERQKLSDGERFQYTAEETQYVGNQYITQGLHVHVGVKDGDTAVQVCDIMQAYLPLLLALSASSPYFRGADTGFHSYRTKLIEVLPIAGIAGFLGDWQRYVHETVLLKKAGMIKHFKDLRLDIRPNPEFGTVEIRICDSLSNFSETLGIIAMIQAMVVFIAENTLRSFPCSLQVMKGNKWQAARYGLAGQFVDSYGLLSERTLPLRQAADDLLHLLTPVVERFYSEEYIWRIYDMLQYGTDAEKQRLLIREGKDYKEMIFYFSNNYWK